MKTAGTVFFSNEGGILAGRKLLHQGTTKKLFETDSEEEIILQFSDKEFEFDGERKAGFKGKGKLRSLMTSLIYEYLGSYNIPTHFIKKGDDAEIRVKKLKMIPLRVVVRNFAAGSLSDRFQLEEGTELKYPVIEYYLKDRKLNYPMISESHAYAFGYASPEEMKYIVRLASKINAVLKSYFDRRKMKLIDYQLEFGRYKNQLMLADEITADTCRLWQVKPDGSLDQNYFRYEGKKAKSSYEEIYNRLVGK